MKAQAASATLRNLSSGRIHTSSPPAGILRTFAHPALALSAMLLLLYLVLVPEVVSRIEARFQQDIAFARHPDAHWTKVENAVQQVQSNDEIMSQIRKTIPPQMSPSESR